jgi:general secretion pathway protein K
MRSERGIALLIVMWSLVLLMVIVLSFSYATKTEMRATIAFKEGIEEKFIAEAGIEMAIREIMFKKIKGGAPQEADKETAVWNTDGESNSFSLGNGSGLVRIIDESGKIDINKTPEIILKGLILNLGVKEEDAVIIVDSILDWRDEDDYIRSNGAESSYYSSLPVPYKPKNADFESIEELMLVRGVTPELFYGKDDKPGLADFVTVYSESGKIKISSAPKEVLMALPGMTEEIAAALIEFRGQVGPNAAAGLRGIMGPAYAAMAQYVTTGEGNTFTVESVGRKSPAKPGFGIKAVITVSGNKFSYKYYRSPWDMTKWKQSEQQS